MRVILASASPRRADLLRAAGYACEIAPVDVDESAAPDETPEVYVVRLAAAKAAACAAPADAVVLAADTTVVVDGDLLGKPASAGDARAMLRRLSGRAHDVYTGVAVRAGGATTVDVERTRVWFEPMDEAEIDWYVASGEPFGKAGAYAVQGLGSRFVSRIEGSYSNVVGLPVAVAHRRLRAAGVAAAAV